MAKQTLEGCAVLETHTLALFETLAGAIARAITDSDSVQVEAQRRAAIEQILWAIATNLDGQPVGTMEDGRPILASLAFVARGSDSAFEVPFVEHEEVLCASRIALHEYVHEAVARIFDRQR